LLAEAFKSNRHYASPLARIFTSALFLDEAYYMSGNPRAIASTALLARYARGARVPLILMSATIHKSHIEWIKLKREEVVTACLEGDGIGGRCDVEIDGGEFIEKASAIEWKTHKIREENVVSSAEELVKAGRRVLIGMRSIARAVNIYRGLREKGVEARILHAGLTLGDRGRVLSEVETLLKSSDRAFALVATPVINAGVDASFDSLIVEAPDFTSIVQWSGRVCRDVDKPCEEPPEVFIVEHRSEEYVLKEVEKLSKINPKISWRIPFSFGGAEGYGRLIDADAEKTEIKGVGREAMKLFDLFYPFFVRQEKITKYLLSEGSPARRSLLVQAFIEGREGDADSGQILERMITLEAWEVEKCAKHVSVYIEVVEEAYDSEKRLGVRSGEDVKELWEDIRKNLESPGRLYRSLVIAHMRKGSRRGVVAGGILILKEVYREGEGLLCIQEGGEG